MVSVRDGQNPFHLQDPEKSTYTYTGQELEWTMLDFSQLDVKLGPIIPICINYMSNRPCEKALLKQRIQRIQRMDNKIHIEQHMHE